MDNPTPAGMTAEQLRKQIVEVEVYARTRCLANDAGKKADPWSSLSHIANTLNQLAARLSGMAAAPGAPQVICSLPVLAYDAGDEVRIEAAQQFDGRTLWKVSRRGSVLATDGQWESEPMPSSRDSDFLHRCRFGTPDEALHALKAAPEVPQC